MMKAWSIDDEGDIQYNDPKSGDSAWVFLNSFGHPDAVSKKLADKIVEALNEHGVVIGDFAALFGRRQSA